MRLRSVYDFGLPDWSRVYLSSYYLVDTASDERPTFMILPLLCIRVCKASISFKDQSILFRKMQSKTYITQLLRKSRSPKCKRAINLHFNKCTTNSRLSTSLPMKYTLHVADTLRKQLITTKGMGAIAKWLFIQKRKRTRYK